LSETAASIQARIDALDTDAAAIGVSQSVTSGDQSTTFQRLSDIRAERAALVSRLATINGQTRTRLAAYDKGV
jgi:hypothetical protein